MKFLCCLVLLVLSLLVMPALAQSEYSSQPLDPVIVFVHGRGQSEKSLELVRNQFIDSFRNSQQTIFGQEIIPQNDIGFVWYADVIDPSADKMPEAPGCKFLGKKNLAADLAIKLRTDLINVAMKSKLGDFGLHLLATDTYKYLTSVSTRCEADSRLEIELANRRFTGRPIVVVAHSMGGIVSFSALEKNAQIVSSSSRLKVASFITLGTQVGLKPILQALEGYLTQPPIPVPNTIATWTNFLNSGDHLAFNVSTSFVASDKNRAPIDVPIESSGNQHSIVTYLSNQEVIRTIIGAWCNAHASKPSTCSKLTPQKSDMQSNGELKRLEETADSLVGRVATFMGVTKPDLRIDKYGTDSTGATPGVGINKKGLIVLSYPELQNYRNQLDSSLFDDLLLYTVAHEMTHIAQDRQGYFSAQSGKRYPRLSIECEADIWAGIVIVNAILEMGETPVEAMRRCKTVIAFAGETGSPVQLGHRAYTDISRPTVTTRALCAVKGLNGGAELYAHRKHIKMSDPDLLKTISARQSKDLGLLGPGDEIWKWSRANADSISNYFPGEEPKYDPRKNFLVLAAASEEGPKALAKTVHVISVPSFVECSLKDNVSEVSLACTYPPLPSTQLAFNEYELMADILRGALLSRGWELTSQNEEGYKLREDFMKDNAYASIRTSPTTRELVFHFISRI